MKSGEGCPYRENESDLNLEELSFGNILPPKDRVHRIVAQRVREDVRAMVCSSLGSHALTTGHHSLVRWTLLLTVASFREVSRKTLTGQTWSVSPLLRPANVKVHIARFHYPVFMICHGACKRRWISVS